MASSCPAQCRFHGGHLFSHSAEGVEQSVAVSAVLTAALVVTGVTRQVLQDSKCIKVLKYGGMLNHFSK